MGDTRIELIGGELMVAERQSSEHYTEPVADLLP